jgi:hypothetical protein
MQKNNKNCLYLTRSFVMSQDIGITHPAAVPTPKTIENQIIGTKYETSPEITIHSFLCKNSFPFMSLHYVVSCNIHNIHHNKPLPFQFHQLMHTQNKKMKIWDYKTTSPSCHGLIYCTSRGGGGGLKANINIGEIFSNSF